MRARGAPRGEVDQTGSFCQGSLSVVEGRFLFWHPRHTSAEWPPSSGPCRHLVKRCHDPGRLGEEPFVEVDHSNEGHQLLDGRRAGEFSDSPDTVRGGGNSVCSDVMAEETEGWFAEQTLLQVEDEAGRLELAEQLLEVVPMFFLVSACHQNVVQVDEGEGKTLADGVHQPLEGLGGVSKSEGGPQKFKKSERGDKSGLVDVFRGYGNLAISTDKADLLRRICTRAAKPRNPAGAGRGICRPSFVN